MPDGTVKKIVEIEKIVTINNEEKLREMEERLQQEQEEIKRKADEERRRIE